MLENKPARHVDRKKETMAGLMLYITRENTKKLPEDLLILQILHGKGQKGIPAGRIARKWPAF
jgi:hypothetical protein